MVNKTGNHLDITIHISKQSNKLKKQKMCETKKIIKKGEKRTTTEEKKKWKTNKKRQSQTEPQQQ